MVSAPIRPDNAGGFIVELDSSARDLLEHLTGEMEALLQTDSPLLSRLFPPPYGDDVERNEGYAALAGPELIENRAQGLSLLRSTVRSERLTAEELTVWMRTVNDMRLALGTLLDIRDDVFREILPRSLVGHSVK